MYITTAISMAFPSEGQPSTVFAHDIFSSDRSCANADEGNIREIVANAPRGENFEKEVQDLRNNHALKEEIRVVYVLISQECNLRCRYCFVKESLKPRVIEKKVLSKLADLLNNTKHRVRVIFYGGEPLINFEGMKYLVENVNNPLVEFSMVTNATYVTPEVAQFLRKHDIHPGVSIDGPEQIHNEMRVMPDGKGSYKDTVKGYFMLKNAGVFPGIACTVGPHNVNSLKAVAKFFVSELKPTAVGFNVLRLYVDDENAYGSATPENTAYRMYPASKYLLEHGIPEDRIGRRRLESFYQGRFWIKDCSGTGNEVAVAYDGHIGPCHGLEGDDRFFSHTIFELDELDDATRLPEWRTASKFLTLNIADCTGCPAISICGAGCYAWTYKVNGELLSRDTRHCRFITTTYTNLLAEIHESCSEKPAKYILRNVTAGDYPKFKEFWEKVSREFKIDHMFSQSEIITFQKMYFRGRGGLWVLVNRENNIFGFANITPDGNIGVYLDKEIRGRGYGKSITEFIIGIAKYLRFPKVYAKTKNKYMEKILENSGFTFKEVTGKWELSL